MAKRSPGGPANSTARRYRPRSIRPGGRAASASTALAEADVYEVNLRSA